MSDSAHQGDAARLEAALDRIARALDRAVPADALLDTASRERGPAVPGPGAAPASGRLAQGMDTAGDAPGPAGPGVDLAGIGARLDGLIAELRDVLGEAGPPGTGLGTDRPSGGEAFRQASAARPGAAVN